MAVRRFIKTPEQSNDVFRQRNESSEICESFQSNERMDDIFIFLFLVRISFTFEWTQTINMTFGLEMMFLFESWRTRKQGKA